MPTPLGPTTPRQTSGPTVRDTSSRTARPPRSWRRWWATSVAGGEARRGTRDSGTGRTRAAAGAAGRRLALPHGARIPNRPGSPEVESRSSPGVSPRGWAARHCVRPANPHVSSNVGSVGRRHFLDKFSVRRAFPSEAIGVRNCRPGGRMVAEPKPKWRTGARIMAGSLCGVALVVCVLAIVLSAPFSAGRSTPPRVAFSDADRSVPSASCNVKHRPAKAPGACGSDPHARTPGTCSARNEGASTCTAPRPRRRPRRRRIRSDHDDVAAADDADDVDAGTRDSASARHELGRFSGERPHGPAAGLRRRSLRRVVPGRARSTTSSTGPPSTPAMAAAAHEHQRILHGHGGEGVLRELTPDDL